MKPDKSYSGKAGPTAYSIRGEGECLVLIHGVGMTREVWTPQVDAFARDFKVLTYDMLGHGASDLPPDEVTLEDFARQLAMLLDHLAIPAARVVGHSMGALVALDFALAYPARTVQVAALNAVFMRSEQQRSAVMARAEAMVGGAHSDFDATIQRWFEQPVPECQQQQAAVVARLLREVNPLGYARTYRLFASSDAVHAQRLPRLEPEALFMTGELDPNSSPEMSKAMSELAPNACVEIVPRARHMMALTHAQHVNALLRSFLLGRKGQPATP